jgi:twitching motility protein PilT
MAMLDKLLATASERRMDAVILESGDFLPPSALDLKKLLYGVAPQRNREEFEAANDTDFAVELPGKARFRANLFRER